MVGWLAGSVLLAALSMMIQKVWSLADTLKHKLYTTHLISDLIADKTFKLFLPVLESPSTVNL